MRFRVPADSQQSPDLRTANPFWRLDRSARSGTVEQRLDLVQSPCDAVAHRPAGLGPAHVGSQLILDGLSLRTSLRTLVNLLGDLLRYERDEHAEHDYADFTGEGAPAVSGLGRCTPPSRSGFCRTGGSERERYLRDCARLDLRHLVG